MTTSRKSPAVVVEIDVPGGPVERRVTSSLSIGRHPGRGGVVIGDDDLTISSVAVRVIQAMSSTSVENASRYAQLEIHGPTGMRLLGPGEELRLNDDCKIVVPGIRGPYSITISGIRPRRTRRTSPTRMGTRRRITGNQKLGDARALALTAMCLARFDPRRWPSGLLTSTQIAAELGKAGISVTPKAVDNKLARIRAQLGERHGVVLGTRDELADFVIRHGIISNFDVLVLRSRQTGRAHHYARSDTRHKVGE